MKYVIKEGTHKKSKSIFIFTGVFLILLFTYQLYSNLLTHEFSFDFPGDWDKVIGILVGIYLIFRSRIFTVRSRDIFIEITDALIKYRLNPSDSIQKIERSAIDKVEVKKGQVILFTKQSKRIIIADFNKVRMRDEQRDSIVKSIKQLLN